MTGGSAFGWWSELIAEIEPALIGADAARAHDYPGASSERQPLHTAYVPADRFDASTPAEWGGQALAALERHGAEAGALAHATGLPLEPVSEVYAALRRKLVSEPIEDLRIDFEDGYGDRGDEQEDADAVRAAAAAIELLREEGSRAMRLGVRVKSLEAQTRARGLRTLGIVLTALAEAGSLDHRFVVTLPKVTSVDQVEAFARLCRGWEERSGAAPGALRFEIQVETPQSILAADGTALVARLIRAAGGRCIGLHYGTYDYSAFCGILGRYQSMEHPVADYAKAVMQVAAAGTGAVVSDGSTNRLPVGSDAQVSAAWREHARLVRRSLERGYYQGWDLHPAQLITRYLASWLFFREGADEAVHRLLAYLGRGAAGEVLDEPATAAALAAALLRSVECGAVDPSELHGLSLEELAGLSRRERATNGYREGAER